MKILMTAFEPFDNLDSNSSLEVLKKINNDEIVKVVLPVSYIRSKEKIIEAIASNSPDIVICLGQAGMANSIRLEKLAINYTRASIPDNDGIKKELGFVIEGNKEAIFTNFPIEYMINDMTSSLIENYNVKLSISAGSYICNSTYYVALNEMKGKALFIHLPYYKNQISDCNVFQMEIGEMVNTVNHIIDLLKKDC